MNPIEQSSKNLSNKSDVIKDLEYLKKYYLNLPLNEKRLLYSSESFKTIEEIPSWEESDNYTVCQTEFKKDSILNSKISFAKLNITSLEIDAIVNAANESLSCGGGVCGAIFNAASKDLLEKNCKELNGCKTGEAKLTYGFKLPAKYIIHTVGPVGSMGRNPELLANCYENSLNLAKKNNLKTIAFPCISTGIFGYPNEPAADVALKTVRNWLENNSKSITRIIFCIFTPIDFQAYFNLLPIYFPRKN